MQEGSESIVSDATLIDETGLTGYWHSAPDFSQGELETYEFFGQSCSHKKVNRNRTSISSRNRDSGSYTLENTVLEISFPNDLTATKHTIDAYIAADAATSGPALIISGQKFWKTTRPDDFIGGFPLYVNHPDAFVTKEYQNREAVIGERSPGQDSQRFIICCDAVLTDIKISGITPSDDPYDVTFYFGDILYRLDTLLPGQYLDYTGNLDIGSMPNYALSFSDQDGNLHTYAFIHGGDFPAAVARCEITEVP